MRWRVLVDLQPQVPICVAEGGVLAPARAGLTGSKRGAGNGGGLCAKWNQRFSDVTVAVAGVGSVSVATIGEGSTASP